MTRDECRSAEAMSVAVRLFGPVGVNGCEPGGGNPRRPGPPAWPVCLPAATPPHFPPPDGPAACRFIAGAATLTAGAFGDIVAFLTGRVEPERGRPTALADRLRHRKRAGQRAWGGHGR